LLTCGAQAIVPGDELILARSALLGLARTIGAERSEAPALRVDLDPAAPPDIRPVLLALGGLGRSEPELGVRGGDIFAPRLREPTPVSSSALSGASRRKVLRIRKRGALDALTFETEPRRPPAAGEVEIGIRAAGLNFRDVLNTLGMYPGDPGALGSECSGNILAVAPDVTGLRVGDEVVAIATDAIASHVTVSAELVVRKPANLGFADAVTLPNAYLTAAQSLRVVAGLRPGQRVLIHAAAGGVGLAALRLARRAGAEVIATAGSAHKRAFVLAAGAAHAFDSRTLTFADDVLRVTGGAGVDVLLNSLSGEFIAAGMRVVRPGGCFVEIGKKGIWTPEEAAERAPGVRYEVVDLGAAIQHDVRSVRKLLMQVLQEVSAGEVAPLPVRAFRLSEAVAAFRYMATARHIGKVVLVPEPASEGGPLTLVSDGTYLVTGGFGGLGFAVAERLSQRGAGELVLVGRNGPGTADQARLEQLRAYGTRVTAVACDIGDRDAVRALWRDVIAVRPPLRGIVHAAGVLSDAPLDQQDAAHFTPVARAKVGGAWHLHEFSAQAPLDFFALYSSSSALFGSPGQANYAAANAFLNGLAAFRQARGLTATSIAWGAWAEVGMAARISEAQRSRWTRLGIGVLDPRHALDALEHALLGQAPHVAIMALDPGRIASQAGPAVRALLGLRAAITPAEPGKASPDALAAVRAARHAGPTERLALLRPYVRRQAARVLGFNTAALDADTPLSALGLDSLMAVQFRNLLETDLALDIPLAQLLAGPTVAQLTEEIAARLDAGGAAPMPAGIRAAGAWEEGSL
jgi:NADPH:quinone reductase-like Zn-dependent oxidoreductase/NADP-dependent 3-hydroxy acid dehydrogenase YdfG/acyl carrier protein